MVSIESIVYEACYQRDVIGPTKGEPNCTSVQLAYMYDPTDILPLEEGEDQFMDVQRKTLVLLRGLHNKLPGKPKKLKRSASLLDIQPCWLVEVRRVSLRGVYWLPM